MRGRQAIATEEKVTHEIMMRVNLDTYQKAKDMVAAGRFPSLSDLGRTALIEYLNRDEQKANAKRDMMENMQEFLMSDAGREAIIHAVTQCMRGGKLS